MRKVLVSWFVVVLLCGMTAAVAETTIDSKADRGIVLQSVEAINPVIEGENPITGLPYDGDYLPVMVNIGNAVEAIPQWGIAEADLIYEMPIDGLGWTRLMALYNSEYPEYVGPIRSARVMHADMRQAWDAAWAFEGGQEKEGSNVFTRIKQLGVYDQEVNLAFNMNGANGSRFKAEKAGRKVPYSHQVKMAKLVEYLTGTGYDFVEKPFLFTDEPAVGDAAAKVVMDFGNGNADSYYVYNEETKDYARFLTEKNIAYYDGNDPETGLTYDNIIVQWTKLSYNGANDCPLLTEVGEGNADFFMNGQHIAGYWTRDDVNNRTIYYDADGSELKLQRGQTWIILASSSFLTVTYE